MQPKKRKRYFIDREVQSYITFRAIVHWGVFVIALVVVLGSIQMVAAASTRSWAGYLQGFWVRFGPSFLVLVLLLPALIVDTIKFSNRFVGPVYRLRQTMRTLAQGEKAHEMKLRKTDLWKGLADDFNLVLRRLNEAESRARANQETPNNSEPSIASDAETGNEPIASKERECAPSGPL